MAAGLIAKTFFRGDTFRFRVQVVNDRTQEAVGSLVGYTFWATGKDYFDPDIGLWQLTLGDGIEIVDDANSWIEVTISYTLTEDWTVKRRRVRQDVQCVDPDGEVFTLAYGHLIVAADATLASA